MKSCTEATNIPSSVTPILNYYLIINNIDTSSNPSVTPILN